MIASQLKVTIEDWAQGLRERSALLSLAKRGELPPQALALYLVSLRHLFAHSQRNMALAAERCAALGKPALRDYFSQKAAEEAGHDGWADDDLSKLSGNLWRELEPAPGVLSLVRMQHALIDSDPVAYMVYALWAEYFTVLLGDEWLAALAQSGFGEGRVTAVAKHVDADRAHAARALSEIDRHLEPGADPGALLAVVGRAGAHFEAFCDQVLGAARVAA